jgi:DNA replication protein DnaC
MIASVEKILDPQQAATESRYWINKESEIRRQVAELNEIRLNMAKVLSGIGVPEKWLSASFDGCVDLPADLVDYCRRFSEKSEGILYLFGIPGSGKTWIATAILRNILASGILKPGDCRYISERSFLDDVRSTFDDPEISPRFLPANHPARARLLILDDLGSTRLTDWGRGEVANLIEKRHADDLITIITTNINPTDLADVIDGRVASRVGESRQLIGFPDRDLRLSTKGPWKTAFADEALEDPNEKTVEYLKRLYTDRQDHIEKFIRSLTNDEVIELIRRIPPAFAAVDGKLTISTVLSSRFWQLRLWQLFAPKDCFMRVYKNQEPNKTVV